MNIYVDIDDTICYYKNGNIGDYTLALPHTQKITLINKLYRRGHTITYWTARGTVTKRDWFSITEQQLQDWGCNYNNLIMGKPAYDLFIDDKTLTSIDQLNLLMKL
jgi:hypothetical protein